MRKRAFLFGAVLVTAIVVAGLTPISLSNALISRYGDALDWRSWRLAGRHSINCGRVRIGQDPGPATSCGREAFAAGRSFRVRYDNPSKDYRDRFERLTDRPLKDWDSPAAAALVRTANGDVDVLSFVGNPTGGTHISFWGQRVDVQSCPGPSLIDVNQQGHLNCIREPEPLSPLHSSSRFDRIIQSLLNELRPSPNS
jgi:hypothetical protein